LLIFNKLNALYWRLY